MMPIDIFGEIDPIERRRRIKEMFPSNTEANNIKFYHLVWENRPHYCEECGRPLEHYSSCFVSHILSRGEAPQFAYDPRNVNILCKAHHDCWELKTTRKAMRIYRKNERIINQLKEEEKQWK